MLLICGNLSLPSGAPIIRLSPKVALQSVFFINVALNAFTPIDLREPLKKKGRMKFFCFMYNLGPILVGRRYSTVDFPIHLKSFSMSFTLYVCIFGFIRIWYSLYLSLNQFFPRLSGGLVQVVG